MKLNYDNIKKAWPDDYLMPVYDIQKMKDNTILRPIWLHVGAGNIFRIFIGSMHQELLNKGLTDTGITVYEGYDEEIIPKSFAPFDNMTLGVTLNADGSLKKEVIASIGDAFSNDLMALKKVISKPSLQMISFTITEKGYTVVSGAVCAGPDKAKLTLEAVAAGLYTRFLSDGKPLALVAMDNFAENGTKLALALSQIAQAWADDEHVPGSFVDYIQSMSYPWTMIDKITPRPSETVAAMLAADGYEDTDITETSKHTFVSSFVNAEAAAYLIIEDDFPNGRPPLEKAGAYLTDKDTVKKMDQMKVCACLNPLHTILAVSGMLLDIPTIAQCMKNQGLVSLIKKAASEALPTVEDPGIIRPLDFLNEVINERFPNPFIPDAPARIACDTSQKVPVRFGETLKVYAEQGFNFHDLDAIPLFIALWMRYRTGVNDQGDKIILSPDPRCPESILKLEGIGFDVSFDFEPILTDQSIFGVNLYEVGLAEKIIQYFNKLNKQPGVVAALTGSFQ